MSWTRGLVVSALFIGSVGCGSDPLQSPDGEGDLVVHVVMSGLLPSRTVHAVINDTIPLAFEGPSLAEPLWAQATTRLRLGNYRVRITGLDPNCAAPDPMNIRLGTNSPAFLSFEVNCRDDLVLAGRALAYIGESDDAWGNSPLTIWMPGGHAIKPSGGTYTRDAVWSEQGDQLAVLRDDTPSLIFLDPEGTLLPFAGFDSPTGVAIAWVPGQVVLSLLETSPDGCRVRLMQPSATSFDQTIPCGKPAATGPQYGGDIAWSPDGLTLAATVGLEPSIRLVNRNSGAIVKRELPEGLVPAVIEWSSENGALFVLATCPIACSWGKLTLLKLELSSGSWNTIGLWETRAGARDVQTLELLDPSHLAVGLIEGSIHVVSLDAPGQSRVFLPEAAYRMSRRP